MKKLALGVCVLSLMFVAACGKKAPESTETTTSTANATTTSTANAPAAAATANY